MTSVAASASKKIKVNWANECVFGAMLSAAFTVMASNAGTAGVMRGSISARVYDLIIMGGILMGTICGIAALILILYQIAEAVMGSMAPAPKAPKQSFQFAKFVKIFLP